jgi:hypothetical protein
MVLAQPSLSISLCVSDLENMARFMPIILNLVSIKILTWALQLQFIWDSCTQIQVYFRLSLSATHANYLSGLLRYMLRSSIWTLLLSWESYNHQPPCQQSQNTCLRKQVCF